MSTHLEACWQHYRAIAENAESAVNALLKQGRDIEAKRALEGAQRDLRELKRNVTESQRSIRADATEARQRNANFGQTAGLFVGSKGRGVLSRGRAAGRRDIAEQAQAALRPYDQLKYAIDDLNAQFDRAKADIRADIQDGRGPSARSGRPDAGGGGGEPPPPPTPAQWAPDPHGRHELRYWGGRGWTEHVSDHGRQSIDPV